MDTSKNRFTQRINEFSLSGWVLRLIYSSVLLPCATNLHAQEEQTSDNPTPAHAIFRHTVNIEKLKEKIYLKELDQDAIKKIGQGNDRFTALWEPSKIKKQYGALLILHGAGQTPDWPGTLHPLRTQVPQHGWATLSISLPEPLKNAAPKRVIASPPPKEKSTGEPTNNEEEPAIPKKNENSRTTTMSAMSPQDIERRVNQRITKAIDFLHKQGQYNIVLVGEGTGAARAAKYADSVLGNTLNKKNKRSINQRAIRALVLINTLNTVPAEKQAIHTFFNATELPILDIFNKSHYNLAIEAKKRRKQAKSKQLTHYFFTPISLIGRNYNDDDENILTRRIRGFLNKHAKGVEIDKR